MMKHQPKKRPRGRPLKNEIEKLDATPEEVAQAIFAAATPPDPSKRKKRRLGIWKV